MNEATKGWVILSEAARRIGVDPRTAKKIMEAARVRRAQPPGCRERWSLKDIDAMFARLAQCQASASGSVRAPDLETDAGPDASVPGVVRKIITRPMSK
jgi:hypothetical protein